MEPYAISAFVTIFSCLLSFGLSYRVGTMRAKYKVPAYERYDMMKDKELLVANRIHMNTVENLVVFLPILWVATIF